MLNFWFYDFILLIILCFGFMILFYLINFWFLVYKMNQFKMKLFESGFDYYENLKFSFNLNFFVFLFIFILFELELVLLIFLMFGYFTYFVFMMILNFMILTFYLEWKNNKMIWFI